MSPTEDMKVEVGNGFAAVRTVIDDEAVAGGGDIFAAGDFGSREEQVAKEVLIIGLCASDARDEFFGNEENVDGRLRRDVAEGQAQVVLKNDIGGDFASDDFFEEGHASWRLSS